MKKVSLDHRNQPFDKHDIINALYCIPADTDRDTWLKAAQALKSSGEPFETFDAWSRISSKYKSSDCQSVWKSISPDGGIGVGTLFYIAKQHGYKLGGKVDGNAVEAGKKEAKQRQVVETENKALIQQEAARKAAQILDSCLTASSHPYLVKKRVKPALDIWVDKMSNIIIPIMDLMGNVHSIQSISPDGFKKFLPNGAIKGHFYQLWSGNENIVICEGYATGVTLYSHYCKDSTVVVAFNAGNLLPVAQIFRNAFPEAGIIIAGDFDASGVGQKSAQAAADSVGGVVSIPVFQSHEKGSDFNDRWCLDNKGAANG